MNVEEVTLLNGTSQMRERSPERHADAIVRGLSMIAKRRK
jgi:hypothetical protein